MTKKIIPFELNLKSSQRVGYTFKARPQILTNDANSAELNFIITDTSSEELTNSTATVLLFMRDGSFFQNTDVTRVNNTFIYTIKPNQAKHSGVAQAQLVVKMGTVENASPLMEFEIVGGLETKPIVEREIQDWTSLTAEAKAFVEQIKDFTLEEFVENKMGEELSNLEVNYATRLTGLEQKDNQLTAQLAQKASQQALNLEKARIDNFIALPEGATTNDASLEDISVGVDGNIYNSPGEAVRGQIGQLKKTLANTQITRDVNFSTSTSGYISDSGLIVATSDFSHTEPIHLNENDKIIVNVKGFNNGTVVISAIAKVNEAGYTSLVNSVDSTQREYQYTATEECDVVISYNQSATHFGHIFAQIEETFKQINIDTENIRSNIVTFNNNEYFDYQNESSLDFLNVGYELSGQGQLNARTGFQVSDFIDIEINKQIYKYHDSSPTKFAVQNIAYYDVNKLFISSLYIGVDYLFETINGHVNAVNYPLLEGAKYIRLTDEISRGYIYKKVPNIIERETGDLIIDGETKKLLRSNEVTVNFGDSIFGNNDSNTGISNIISQFLHSTVYNCGFGGTQMCDRGSRTTGYDRFDFANLVDCVVSGDYSELTNAVITHEMPSYYADRIARLSSIDFSKVNIITLNYATNDYTYGRPLADFKASAVASIGKLQVAFPHIKVILITPTWRCWLTDGVFSEDGNTKVIDGNTLIDFCIADAEISKKLNIQLIDVYNIGINKNNWTYYFTASDTTHQDVNGRKRIADVIARKLLVN